MDENQRRERFYLTYEGKISRYHLVLPDCSSNNAGLYGLVAGALFQDYTTPYNQLSEQERKAHLRMCAEIVALKPAFIVFSMSADRQSIFGDYFAIAMLLSEQEPPQAGARE